MSGLRLTAAKASSPMRRGTDTIRERAGIMGSVMIDGFVFVWPRLRYGCREEEKGELNEERI